MSNYAKGLILAAIAGIALAFITPFARVTYDAGSGPLTMVGVRISFGAIVLSMIAITFGIGLRRVPKAAWPAIIVGAVSLGIITFGYMLSVAYIPVGLAALVFYTFPLVVLAAESIRTRRRPSLWRILIFTAAFLGLALALGPDAKNLDPVGVALAFVGGLGTVGLLLAGQKASVHVHPMAFAVYANVLLAPVAVAILIGFDGYAPPTEAIGWIAFAGAGIAYLIGVTAQISAVKFAPPGDVALVHNIEPVVSIAIAWVLLAETLSVIQVVGVCFVMAAVFAGTRGQGQ